MFLWKGEIFRLEICGLCQKGKEKKVKIKNIYIYLKIKCEMEAINQLSHESHDNFLAIFYVKGIVLIVIPLVLQKYFQENIVVVKGCALENQVIKDTTASPMLSLGPFPLPCCKDIQTDLLRGLCGKDLRPPCQQPIRSEGLQPSLLMSLLEAEPLAHWSLIGGDCSPGALTMSGDSLIITTERRDTIGI